MSKAMGKASGSRFRIVWLSMGLVSAGLGCTTDLVSMRNTDGTGGANTDADPNGRGGAAPGGGLGSCDDVFNAVAPHQIHFTLTEEEYREIDADDRPKVHASLVIDGQHFPDVGLKLKGEGTYQKMAGKPAFIVDMNQWTKGTRYCGLKAFKLHNGVKNDPTQTHEYLSYLLAADVGLLAPRVGFAQVYSDGRYLGVYTLVEKHDDVMIAHRNPAQERLGVVLEPSGSFRDFGSGTLSEGNVEDTLEPMWEQGPWPPDPEVVESLTTLDELLASPGTEQATAAFWDHVNKNAFLDYMAWEAMTSDIDGYLSTHNWRLFVDGATYEIEWVPTGADGTFPCAPAAFPRGVSVGRAFGFCLDVPSCRREYAQHLLRLADRMEALDLKGRYEALAEWLNPLVEMDPTLAGSASGIRQTGVELLMSSPETVRAQVVAEYPELHDG